MLESLRGGLIVSCQAYPGEPLRDPRAMALIAQSAAIGGAVGIRAQGLDDIRMIHEFVQLPQIGLWKDGPDTGVFITPTLKHALAVINAGAQIVALDGTSRTRPDNLTLAETIKAIHEQTDALVMADASSLADGIAAQEGGADIVGTTLSGYIGNGAKPREPDLGLVSDLSAKLTIPVFAEGRIHTPAHAQAALKAGAFAVVVGTAITHPATIASWFVEAMR